MSKSPNVCKSSLLSGHSEQAIQKVLKFKKLCKSADEKISIKEEEIEMDIEDFESERYIIQFPTHQDDNTINNIDISCVKQEIDIAKSADINYSLISQSCSVHTYKNSKPVEKAKSTDNTISSCSTLLNVPSIHSSTNNDVIHKKSREKPSEIVKKVDLKRILNTPQENSIPIHPRTVCILCAGSDSANNKSIAHFAKMILDLSGINQILNTESPPMACSSCVRQLQIVDIFKKQIIYTNNLIMNAGITVKSSPAYDAGIVSKVSNVWEEVDEEAESCFTFETTRKTFSKTTSDGGCKSSKVKSNLNNKDMQPSVNTEDKTEYLDKRPFLCAVCGNQYRTMERLKVHSECVHGARNHLCYICGNAFNSSGLLKNHFRTHSGEKPFQCEYCNRKFSLKWNLDQHKRLHSNTLPYKCKLCQASYRHNVTLKKHVVKSHTAAECAVSS